MQKYLINKEKITFEQTRKILLEILIDVDKFCSENDLTYFLACGSLLGAIRHKGYIPWDDDLDIMMPRPDYERFLEIYKHDRYSLCKPSDGMYFFAKVYDKNTETYESGIDYKKYKPIGVGIDVFPLDGIVNDEKIVNKIIFKSNIFETLLRLSNQPIFYRKNPLKAINRIIPRIIGSRNIVRIIEKIAKTYKYEDSDYVIRIKTTPNGSTGALPKDVYGVIRKEFEGHLFNVPSGYDVWLSRFFGNDYMEMPPEEKRRIHERDSYFI